MGVESIIGFIIAIAIFLMVLTVILFATKSSVPPDTGKVDLQSKANQALNLLVTTPGVPENWNVNPDSGLTKIERMGLTKGGGSTVLSSDKFNCMSGASLYANSSNGKLDYAEAKTALGMAGYDFHIRAYPVFTGSGTGYGTMALGDLRVAYIGDYSDPVNPPSTLWDNFESAASKEESDAVSRLGAQFTNVLYIPPLTLPPPPPPLPPPPPILERQGDKFADKSDYIQSNLVPRLNSKYYQILVVGSNVDQDALTPNPIKGAIESWVKEGGKIIVLGGQQNANWLAPFLTTGTRGASGGTYVPDSGHPVLNAPNKLNYPAYPDPGRVWPVPNETYSHIITKGLGQNDKMNDVLALSNDGALDAKGKSIFGNGTVILTTYLPCDIATQLGQDEERMFLANLFMYAAHRTVYLDYGPAIPSGVDVAFAERLPLVEYTKIGNLEIRIVIYVWKGA